MGMVIRLVPSMDDGDEAERPNWEKQCGRGMFVWDGQLGWLNKRGLVSGKPPPPSPPHRLIPIVTAQAMSGAR